MGTLFVDKLDPQSGTALEIGSSGDTMTVPSGATFNVAGTLQSGGAAVANTPAFYAQLTSNQSMSDNTWTKVQFNSEDFDTDNTYDNSTNYRFTPAVAGKYYVFAGVNVDSGGSSRIYYAQTKIYKNGSEYSVGYVDYTSNLIRASFVPIFSLMDLDADDYREIYAYIGHTQSTSSYQAVNQTMLTIFKVNDS